MSGLNWAPSPPPSPSLPSRPVDFVVISHTGRGGGGGLGDRIEREGENRPDKGGGQNKPKRGLADRNRIGLQRVTKNRREVGRISLKGCGQKRPKGGGGAERDIIRLKEGWAKRDRISLKRG